MNITGDQSPLNNIKKLLLDMGKYVEIHQEMFGSYPGELMPRPDVQDQRNIPGFLEKRESVVFSSLFLDNPDGARVRILR